MSHFEWESGELTLPRAAIVPMRRAIIARNNQIATEALAVAKKLWADAKPAERKRSHVLGSRLNQMEDAPFRGVSSDVANRVADILGLHRMATRPPQKQHAGLLGASTTEFHHEGAYLSFDSKTGQARWSVAENNHAVEHAHLGWLGTAFFEQLNQVRWTRGTGGWFTGNDEYNQGSTEYGAGSNYVTSAWGPVGAANHPSHTVPYTKADGARVSLADINQLVAKQANRRSRAAAGWGGTAARGKTTALSTAGSFAPKGQSDPEVWL